MQLTTLSVFTFIACMLFNQNIAAQTSQPDPSNFDRFISQVYVQSGKDFISPDTRRYAYMKELFENRIVYVQNDKAKLDLDTSLPLLSSVPLYTVYQKGLAPDAMFNPETFNPFKYNFDFYSPVKQTFRVDGTGYLVVIHPQVQVRN